RFHFRDYGGHLARRELRHHLHIAPVFIAKRDVGKQVLHGSQALGFEHGGAARADSLDVDQRCCEIERRRQGCKSVTISEVKQTLILLLMAACAANAELRLGIIGTDTSHVGAFTKILNDEVSPDHIPGARIVAAYKGGSKDVESSYTRVDKYAEELR